MSETSRLVVGLGLSTLLPIFVPWVNEDRRRAAAATALVGLWAVVPTSEAWGWALLVVAIALQPVLVRERAPLLRGVRVGRVGLAVIASVAVGAAAAVLADPGEAKDAAIDVLESDRALVTTLALLAAIFPTGALIGWLTAPWARAVEAQLDSDSLPRGLEGAGRYIGWLERGGVFWAIVLGRPEAVAVIFTAKSIARFPSFSREAFAEYYLIGTLLSVFAGIAVAVATRLLLGLDAIGD